jgi:hypothetical protein
MADQRRSGRGKGVPHHPLVEALASDPEKPPMQATKLFGLPGPAADSESTRVWLDRDLTTYVDVPDEAILHSQTLENDQGTILWVESSATLTHSATSSQQVQAEFLGGAIAAGNLRSAARVNLNPMELFELQPPNTFDSGCPVPQTLSQEECHTWDGCMSRDWICRPAESTAVACPARTTDPPCEPDGPGGGRGQAGPRGGGARAGVGGGGVAWRPRPPLFNLPEPSHFVECDPLARPLPTPLRISVGIPCP